MMPDFSGAVSRPLGADLCAYATSVVDRAVLVEKSDGSFCMSVELRAFRAVRTVLYGRVWG